MIPTGIENESFVGSFLNGIRATFMPQPSLQSELESTKSKQLSQDVRVSGQNNGGRRGRGRGKITND